MSWGVWFFAGTGRDTLYVAGCRAEPIDTMRILNSSTVFIALGLALGLGSAIQSLDGWGMQPVADNPGWKEWRLSVNDRLQPYALGHFLASGSVPTPISTHYFARELDDDGNALRGDCNFVLEGPALQARWWSLSIQDASGASPHSILSAGKAVLDNNMQLRVTIALHPVPGNWLQPSDSGAFTLHYVVSEPEKGEILNLPHIKKGSC